MEINVGVERIVELEKTYSAEQIQGLAMTKRVDAFGQMARLFQRPRPEDIEIATVQKRYEPFWFAAASARYVYDRRHTYRIDVAPEVHAVTLQGTELPVVEGRTRSVEVEAVNQCVEEQRRELLVDATRGDEAPDLRKYLTYQKTELDGLAKLEQEDAVVVPPTVMSSFVVRKLAASLMKTFHADVVREERIDVEEVILYYRPIYAVEYVWKAKDKRQVLEFDALTGESRAEATQIKKQVMRALDNDTLFDIGADTLGVLIPGSNVAIKVSRFAVRKALR